MIDETVIKLSRKKPARAIGLIGAGKCDSATAALAEEVGRRLAEQGFTLVCGGLGGVMQAACRGAKKAGGKTVGILPGKDPSAANPWVEVPVATGVGELRNFFVVAFASAVIAVGGEYGTLSEIGFALKTGVPVIGLNTWELRRAGKIDKGIRLARSPEEAVQLALQAARRSKNRINPDAFRRSGS
jgi:uncharacterized protein (TIGR00725 family)